MATTIIINPFRVGAGGGGSPPVTYLLNDKLLYANAGLANAAGWVDSTSPGWGGTPALGGNPASYKSVGNYSAYYDFGTVGNLSSYAFIANPSNYTSGTPRLVFFENTDSYPASVLFEIIVLGSQLRMACGSQTADISYTPGTTYYFRIDYNATTRTATFYVTTSPTSWGAAVATLTNPATPTPSVPNYITIGTTFGNADATFANLLIRDGATVPDNPF